MLKVIEEVGEVDVALARNNESDLRDGIGDVVVTLIILVMQNNMDLYECLNQAKSYLRKLRVKLSEKRPIFVHVTFYVYSPKLALSNKQKRLKIERMYCDQKLDLDNYF